MADMDLDLQIAVESSTAPDPATVRHWAEVAIDSISESRQSLTIRITDPEEIRNLNRAYRGKDQETNVLSFPFDCIPGVESGYLGDIAICEAVVVQEAAAQNKPALAHWAHMVVHGVLHLGGYDHVDGNEAREMEDLEIAILSQLGFANPYAS